MIEKQFNKKGVKRLNKAWKSFYEKYTKFGYFEFSKVFYSDNYALFYFVRSASPLTGKGEIVIFKQINDEWEFFRDIPVWCN